VKCEGGCEALKGEVYWAQHIGVKVCPVYRCVNNHQLKNCGECEKIPCEMWFSLKDPNMTDEQHLKSIKDRVAVLKAS